MQTTTFKTYGVCWFLFMAPFSACTLYFKNIEYVTLFVSIFLLFLGGSHKYIKINTFCKHVCLLFYLPIVASIPWAIIKMGFVNDVAYYDYISSKFISRIVHYLLFFLILYESLQADKFTPSHFKRFLMSYGIGIFVILGLMGFWQVLHQLTGVWCPELETRDALYFARSLGFNRVTSFADEPSFLAPFLIDGILIFCYLKKYILSIALLILLAFSMSFGGFCEIFVLGSIYLLYSNNKVRLYSICGVILIILVLVFAFPELTEIVQVMIDSRKELQSGFDVDDTGRTAMLIQPLVKYINNDVISLIFGAGPASLYYLYQDGNSDMLFGTSNNFFVDMLYEGGIVSIICFCVFLLYVWRKVSNSSNIIPKLFICHLILSSLYRADYASTRYTAIFIIIFCFLTLNNNSNIRKLVP